MDTNKQEAEQDSKKPDENSGILIETKVKIFDPETEEVYLEGRA